VDEQPRLADVWASRDYPVLVAVAQMLEQGRSVQAVEVAEAIGRPQHDVVLALNNLGHMHLIVKDSSTYDGPDNYVTGIRPEGLEATGQWPSSDVAAERLIAALDALVDNAPENSPKHKRLVAARNGLLGIGRDVLVNVGSAVITGQLPSSS